MVVVQFEIHRYCQIGKLWETVSMPKRNLRIVKSAGGVPLLGVCESCNQTFTAAAHPLGEASKTDVRDQFEAHKCKRQDASQAAARIVREATENK